MNLLLLLHNTPKKSWKTKCKEYFLSQHFSTFKIYIR